MQVYDPALITDYNIRGISIDQSLGDAQVSSVSLGFKSGRMQAFGALNQPEMPELVLHHLFETMNDEDFNTLRLAITQRFIRSPLGSYLFDCLTIEEDSVRARLKILRNPATDLRNTRHLLLRGSSYAPYTI